MNNWLESIRNKAPSTYVLYCGASVMIELFLGSVFLVLVGNSLIMFFFLALIIFTGMFWIFLAQESDFRP